MLDNNSTCLFDVTAVNEEQVLDTLKDVYDILEERGYQPINQLVGYLISGDPGYISSHKEARNRIIRLDRANIIEVLLKGSLRK